jgi:hypothetical protein
MGVQFAGNILVQSNGGPLPISAGGTGQTTSPTAINALLPTQAGQSGKVLSSDGTNVSWSAAAGGSPGGANTQIQYNDAGTFGGNAFLVVNKSTGAITSTSTLTNTGVTITWPEATMRTLKFQTAGSDRWLLQANSTAETGSSVGSDFECVAVADNGATQNIAYSISRATHVVDFKAAPTINGSLITSAASTLTGTTLASNVVSSSLTSVGTLTSLTVNGPVFTNSSGSVEIGNSGGSDHAQLFLTNYAGLGSAGIAIGTPGGATGITSSGANAALRIGYLTASLANSSDAYIGYTSTSSGFGTTAGGLVLSSAGSAGIFLRAGASTRLYIDSNGAWNLNTTSSGNGGTSGQVLTSSGVSSAPTWTTPTPPAGSMLKTGDTMTGFLTIAYANPVIQMNAAASGQSTSIYLATASSNRWVFGKSATAESGSNAGSDFFLTSLNDTGAAIGNAISITRSDMTTTMGGQLIFGKSYVETQTTPTLAAAFPIDCSLGNNFTVALSATAITSINFTNVPAAGRSYSCTLYITQDGTGSRTMALNSVSVAGVSKTIKWAGGTAPTITATASKIDVVSMVTYDGGNNWLGFIAGQNF